ncbi:MAG TPA: aldo/keto reductase [Firmicutes bacterium]|nr:aldo/keto reductase [Bacillota bacterium]
MCYNYKRRIILMKLANGVSIPDIGLGVYKMAGGQEMNEAINEAYKDGYRLFDTAQMYENEKDLGDAIKVISLPRKDIFIITKVRNSNQWFEQTINSLNESLSLLQTIYVDSFLIYWPGQNKERMISTWKAMEKLYSDGLVRSIGVCNFERSQLEFLLANCNIAPMINQIEHTPLLHDDNLLKYCHEHNIVVMAWAPIMRGNFSDDKILKIAEKHQKTPAQILLRWNVQLGIVPIPKSKNPQRILENISIFDFKLDDEDMNILNNMNINKRTSHDPLTYDF